MNKELKLHPMTINSPEVHREIENLAKTIDTYWNNDETFGYYLLEKKPDTYKTIAEDLLKALAKNPDYHKIYIIRDQANKDLGYILLKNYSDTIIDDPVFDTSYLPQSYHPNVEVSYRTLEKWVCARALREVMRDYWQNRPDIKSLLGHHAVDNKASGLVFAHNWFAWLRYHDQYVDLPNIKERSDTIMWILEKEIFDEDIQSYQEYQQIKQKLKSESLRLYHNYHDSHHKIDNWYNEIYCQISVADLSFNNQ